MKSYRLKWNPDRNAFICGRVFVFNTKLPKGTVYAKLTLLLTERKGSYPLVKKKGTLTIYDTPDFTVSMWDEDRGGMSFCKLTKGYSI